MPRDNGILTSTSKILRRMERVLPDSKLMEALSSMEPVPLKDSPNQSMDLPTGPNHPSPALTQDMGELLKRILNEPNSKKYSPKD